MNTIQFLSAFGLGAIISAFIQWFFTYRLAISNRKFQEKKDSYIGFMDAIYKSDIVQNAETSYNIGHWINRIQLVGSEEVRFLCKRFLETNPIDGKVHPDRPEVFKNLKKAMGKDLGITTFI